jgi:hypothetical protein
VAAPAGKYARFELERRFLVARVPDAELVREVAAQQ